MIQVMITGFFVCLAVKAGMDVYDSSRKMILNSSPQIKKHLAEEYDHHVRKPLAAHKAKKENKTS